MFLFQGLSSSTYENACVGATADGAAVNFGKKKGVLTLFQQERPWLLRIHCCSHRFELAMKGSVLNQKEFKAVVDLMVSLYYYQKASGKFTRHLKSLAQNLQVKVRHHVHFVVIMCNISPLLLFYRSTSIQRCTVPVS